MELQDTNEQKMNYFAKIDLRSAYNQIEIDKKFKGITMINTPIRWTHLPFIMKTLGHIFQKAIKTILLEKIRNNISG